MYSKTNYIQLSWFISAVLIEDAEAERVLDAKTSSEFSDVFCADAAVVVEAEVTAVEAAKSVADDTPFVLFCLINVMCSKLMTSFFSWYSILFQA